MKYIILDMEWNQPFTMAKTVKEPVYLVGEIIQIGAVKLDENFRAIDNFKITVKPRFYTKMHRKVSKLTSITDQDLIYGFPFEKAVTHFKKWCGSNFVFLTWGPDDMPMLRDNLCVHGLEVTWLPESYDVQRIFNVQITKNKKQLSLVKAVDMLEEVGKTAHDALNDANNTYMVCKHLDMEKGIDEYIKPEPRVHSKESCDAVYTEKVLKLHKDGTVMMEDDDIISFRCPYCNEIIKCKDWIKQNGYKKITVGECSCGEKYFLRLKFVKRQDGFVSISKILYEMTEDRNDYYHIVAEKRMTTKSKDEQLALVM